MSNDEDRNYENGLHEWLKGDFLSAGGGHREPDYLRIPPRYLVLLDPYRQGHYGKSHAVVFDFWQGVVQSMTVTDSTSGPPSSNAKAEHMSKDQASAFLGVWREWQQGMIEPIRRIAEGEVVPA